MPARHVTRAATVAEPADNPRRAVVKARAIAGFLRESLLDIPPYDLGERQSPFTRLRAQAARLLFGELNLCPDHRESVSTS